MTLFSVAGRARVTDVKMKQSAATGTEIVVGIAFRRATLTGEERAALQDYYGNFVDVSIAAIQREAHDPNNNPMDQELARRQSEAGQEERMRPLPGEVCIDCAAEIEEGDEDRGFHIPPLGAPSPLCGACVHRRREEEPEEAPTDPQSWCPIGEHWLALEVGAPCEIHDCATFFDPEAAAGATSGEVPEVVDQPAPVLAGPISWCHACKAPYPFAAGGQCWTCSGGTVSEAPEGMEAATFVGIAPSEPTATSEGSTATEAADAGTPPVETATAEPEPVVTSSRRRR